MLSGIFKMKSTVRNRQGFTILELLIVMSIIATLAATYMYSNKSRERSTKVQATAAQVTELLKASNTWREMQGSALFTGISITNLVSAGLYPGSTNPFGGIIGVSSQSAGRIVRIREYGLDPSSAQSLADILAARGGQNITIGGTTTQNVYADF
jgi:prepilin-type N-terminal cleavage/methylation domain-containing protein